MVVKATRIFLEASHELLRLGYAVRFRAGGQSMHPTIKDGEMITVEPVTPGDVKRGDILLYEFKKSVIAHRVMRVERKAAQLRFILRGDSSQTCDAPVEASEILGRVISVERKGRAVSLVSKRAKLLRITRVRASRYKARLMR
ncbi:MAG TPA: signal peptidase I [Blastocatellia bacterium]|nr:signal peptidase I [Blastocatellia bacterium]